MSSRNDLRQSLRIAVGIPTSGRPGILAETIAVLMRQSRPADHVFICPSSQADVDPAPWRDSSTISIVYGKSGLPAQRNTLLAAADDFDIVVFFDDDFFPETGFLREIDALFVGDGRIAMATGTVLADGILGPGLAPDEAYRHLDAMGPLPVEILTDVHNGYGCNMAVRLDTVRSLGLRFDEKLPLYGWLEDVDFSRRLAPAGRIVRSNRLVGVHLGNKGGRTKGVRLGYSQVVNPLYMVRKGTLDRSRAYRQIARNILANAVRSLNPEPWIDRKGRLVGNLRGALDAARGRLDPGRILTM